MRLSTTAHRQTDSGYRVYWLEENNWLPRSNNDGVPQRWRDGKNGSNPRVAAEFAAGSLETELSAIGKAVPAREWAKVPADYFANLDHYLHGAPKKK